VCAMQNVDRDLKEAFRGTLGGNFEERRQTIERVFTPDAHFWCAARQSRAFAVHVCMSVCGQQTERRLTRFKLVCALTDALTVCGRHLAHNAYGAKAPRELDWHKLQPCKASIGRPP